MKHPANRMLEMRTGTGCRMSFPLRRLWGDCRNFDTRKEFRNTGNLRFDPEESSCHRVAPLRGVSAGCSNIDVVIIVAAKGQARHLGGWKIDPLGNLAIGT